MVDANSAMSASILTSSGASVGVTTEVRAQFRVVSRIINAGVRHQGGELVVILLQTRPSSLGGASRFVSIREFFVRLAEEETAGRCHNVLV